MAKYQRVNIRVPEPAPGKLAPRVSPFAPNRTRVLKGRNAGLALTILGLNMRWAKMRTRWS